MCVGYERTNKVNFPGLISRLYTLMYIIGDSSGNRTYATGVIIDIIRFHEWLSYAAASLFQD